MKSRVRYLAGLGSSKCERATIIVPSTKGLTTGLFSRFFLFRKYAEEFEYRVFCGDAS